MTNELILLPLGYNIADNDLGDLEHQYSNIYKRSNIRTAHVRNFFGFTHNRISLLCEPPLNKLNIWAAFKPNGILFSTDNSHQHGMYPDVGTMPYDWRFIPPTATKRRRLGEFIGYNHNAEKPGFWYSWVEYQGEVLPTITHNEIDYYIWENENEEHTITIGIKLPEFDIRGFSRNINNQDYWISHGRIARFINDELQSIGSFQLSDSIISNKLIQLTFSFTPTKVGDTWFVNTYSSTIYSTLLKAKCFLDNNRSIDINLDDFYVNFPSEEGGLIEKQYRLTYRYYEAPTSIDWKKCEYGLPVGTGSAIVKHDRLGIESPTYQNGTYNELPYGEEGYNESFLNGVYQIDDEIGEDAWYEYEDGARGWGGMDCEW